MRQSLQQKIQVHFLQDIIVGVRIATLLKEWRIFIFGTNH
jgi:hypothetical protein